MPLRHTSRGPRGKSPRGRARAESLREALPALSRELAERREQNAQAIWKRTFYVGAKWDRSRESGFVNTQDLAWGLPFFTGTQKGVFVSTSLPRDRSRVVKKGFLTSSCSGLVKLFRSEPPPTPGLHVSSVPPPPRWVWYPRVRKHSSPALRFPSWSPWQFFHRLLEELVCICSQRGTTS